MNTYTYIHTHMYIYIYTERERERLRGTWNKFMELSGMLVRKQALSLRQAGKICGLLNKFCYTVLKPWNLLLQMRQCCVGWSVV